MLTKLKLGKDGRIKPVRRRYGEFVVTLDGRGIHLRRYRARRSVCIPWAAVESIVGWDGITKIIGPTDEQPTLWDQLANNGLPVYDFRFRCRLCERQTGNDDHVCDDCNQGFDAADASCRD